MVEFNSCNIEGLESALKENAGDNKSFGNLTVSMNNVKFLSELYLVYNEGSKGLAFLGILTNEGYIKPYSIMYGKTLLGYEDLGYNGNHKAFVNHAIKDKAQAIYYSSGGFSSYNLMKSFIAAGKNNISFISIPTAISLYSTDRKNIDTCETKSGLFNTWINEQVFSQNGELKYEYLNFFNSKILNFWLDYHNKKGSTSELELLQKNYLREFWDNHCTP
ncbi:MAG: hypothetical protein PHN56_02225 [Candidatus Nanoarchaeia archaeon]|nr:hypothetical protein [Candidatus Nanoarchaeia archaeon]